MNCGIPYCHGTGSVAPGTPGCPVNNQIPDFNDLVYQGNWEEAARNLHSTNNFPEFTGRICPAPCEASCTLNIDDNPVTIKTIECAIVDRAWDDGWIKPEIAAAQDRQEGRGRRLRPGRAWPARSSSRAPAMTCIVYEKFAKAGGLLRYGIPDFKMEKHLIDRRVAQMEAEGVTFHYGAHVGVERSTVERELLERLRRGGADRRRRAAARPADPRPRPRRHPFRDGFPAAAEPPRRRRAARRRAPILAGGKHVVVIGGGDTGSDCIGTSIRQGALSVTQLEIMPQPPEKENKALTWPNWPLKLRTSSSHEEGAEREFAVLTQKFTGENGKVAEAALRAGRRQVQADPRHRIRAQGRSRAARHGLRASGARGPARRRSASTSTRAAMCSADTDDYQTSRAEGVRRRRHAPRPVAGGLGDPRRPPVRARDRQVPDGRDDAAAVGVFPIRAPSAFTIC